MIWTALVTTVAIVLAGFAWWWHRTRFDRFFERTRRALKTLGYDIVWASEAVQRSVVTECIAMWRAIPNLDHRRLAMTMFVYYCTEHRPFRAAPLKNGGGITGAIPIMLRWKAETPQLGDQVDDEIAKLVAFLDQQLVESGLPEEEILAAQANLYHLAAGSPDFDWREMAEQVWNDAQASEPEHPKS